MAQQIAERFDDLDGLVDLTQLDAWLKTRTGIGSGPITAIRKLTGGLQNSVFLISRGKEDMILRRPGKHLKPKSNETMLREARVLTALEGSAVPHPRVLATCADPDVIGACFFLMEPLEGFAQSGDLPGQYATDARWRRAMGEELVKAAAALGAVDPVAAGLADLGQPSQWHERQVERWRSQLEGYAVTPGYDSGELPHVNEVGRWLADNLPTDRRIGLVHGDMQFPNVMFSLKAPKISGVLDWELVSLGDPLLDLGWILSSWSEPDDPEGKAPMVRPWDGFQSRRELVELYGALSGRNMSEMPWFFALACYKLACLLEGTYAASKAGKVPANVGEAVHRYATWLMTKARQIIAD